MYNFKIITACVMAAIIPIITYTTPFPPEVKLNTIMLPMVILLAVEIALLTCSVKANNAPLEFVVSVINVWGGLQGIVILAIYTPYYNHITALHIALALVVHLASHLAWIIKLIR